MVMTEINNDLIKATIQLCRTLDGPDRTEFIEDAYAEIINGVPISRLQERYRGTCEMYSPNLLKILGTDMAAEVVDSKKPAEQRCVPGYCLTSL